MEGEGVKYDGKDDLVFMEKKVEEGRGRGDCGDIRLVSINQASELSIEEIMVVAMVVVMAMKGTSWWLQGTSPIPSNSSHHKGQGHKMMKAPASPRWSDITRQDLTDWS